jgi:hypothetical protein
MHLRRRDVLPRHLLLPLLSGPPDLHEQGPQDLDADRCARTLPPPSPTKPSRERDQPPRAARLHGGPHAPRHAVHRRDLGADAAPPRRHVLRRHHLRAHAQGLGRLLALDERARARAVPRLRADGGHRSSSRRRTSTRTRGAIPCTLTSRGTTPRCAGTTTGRRTSPARSTGGCAPPVSLSARG